MNNDNDGFEIILEKNNKLFQVEENNINETRVSCEVKKGIYNQIFYLQATIKTIPSSQSSPQIQQPQVHNDNKNPNLIVEQLKYIGYPPSNNHISQFPENKEKPKLHFPKASKDYVLNLFKQGKLVIP